MIFFKILVLLDVLLGGSLAPDIRITCPWVHYRKMILDYLVGILHADFDFRCKNVQNVIFYVFLHISTSCRLNTRKDRMDPRQVVAVGVMLYHPHAMEQIISSESLLKIIMKSRQFRLSKIINFFNRKS